MGDVTAAATIAAVTASATGKVERERDAAAVASVEAAAVATAAEMEEIAEAPRFGEAPVEEVEDPEVPQRYNRTMMRICPPCPFGTGEIVYYPCRDIPPHSPGSRYLQELAHVRTVMGGLRA